MKLFCLLNSSVYSVNIYPDENKMWYDKNGTYDIAAHYVAMWHYTEHFMCPLCKNRYKKLLGECGKDNCHFEEGKDGGCK